MFNRFKRAVHAQFEVMKNFQLYKTEACKDELWQLYLSSFPEGSNPMFKERTEHDCNCCKQFIRTIGNVVAIIDGKLVSIWDGPVDDPNYSVVSQALANFVKSHPISNLLYHTELRVGTDKNYQLLEGGGTRTWEHFYVELPKHFVIPGDAIGPRLSDAKATHDVFKRGLDELSIEDIDTVLELIAQNSLYRGQEHVNLLQNFRTLKAMYAKVSTEGRDLFVWKKMEDTHPGITRIRNTVIGTILVDLAEGKDLEAAVRAYEVKVAPTNYKRPTALVSKRMVEDAKKTIEELGYLNALERRHAVVEDLTINNVLFADRTAKKAMDVFDEIADKVATGNTKTFDKIEEVHIDKFVADILPKAESIELMFENKHTNNLVSLIAPKDKTAKGMFKWPNNFSWAYTGELADSIKERVKKAGGKVDGDVRCSLSWFNYDDLDLHMIEPDGSEVCFRSSVSRKTHGRLDVDMNAGGRNSRTPVENICYPDRKLMTTGVYKLYVHNFSKRESVDVGFDVEIEIDGVVTTFSQATAVPGHARVNVAEIHCSKDKVLTVKPLMSSTQASKDFWGINTQKFHKVKMVLNSPNHWDENQVGNKHVLFVLDGCKNPDPARGFFNEFLDGELNKHRKVLEVLGTKLRVEPADEQLSGVGFSSTQRNDVICKVNGSFSRMLKITI